MKELLRHKTDHDGVYCYSLCDACKIDLVRCHHCDTVHGRHQWHGMEACHEAFKVERAKQLCFPFYK